MSLICFSGYSPLQMLVRTNMSIQTNISAFRSRFSEFSSVGDPEIQVFLDLAGVFVDSRVWPIPGDAELATLYLAAHLSSMRQQALANASDGSGWTDLFVQSVRFGERGVTYGRRMDTAANNKSLGVGEQSYDDTMYGQIFLSLRSRNVIPVLTV